MIGRAIIGAPASKSGFYNQANLLRTWGCVVVVGAGASRSLGFPLASELHSLVWHALDSDPQALELLAGRLDVAPAPAKQLIANDAALVTIGLQVIAESTQARTAYQHAFARLNEQRVKQPSPAHDSLVQLLHRGTAELIISLNWDTLLETAYLRRYGAHLRADGPIFFKPHGDATFPDHEWVLPHEAGRVPAMVVEGVRRLVEERPRILLSVGYSERDEVVVENLTRPLSERWQVIRVSPSASGKLDIPHSAETAIPSLVTEIHPRTELPGWEYVRFDHQHDLADALLGRRLGPNDVETCPRLPQVDEVDMVLDVSNSVEISAGPGHGKSISAYQAAYRLWLSGREVLRPVDPRTLSIDMIDSLEQLRRPSVIVVDDAQLGDEQVIRKLVNVSSSDLAIIVATTTSGSSFVGDVRINGNQAVQALAQQLKRRRLETAQTIRQLGVRVGDGWLDIPIERQIDAASKSETPWQFMFVLTEGWRRARTMIYDLRQMDRADLLLGAIAAGQFLTLDAGVPTSWLNEVAQVYERDRAWVAECLRVLDERRLIIGGTDWRCLHINFAEVVLRLLCEDHNDPMRTKTLQMIQRCVLRADVPLGGVQLLLFRVWYMDSFRWTHVARSIVDDYVLHHLASRCWSSASSQEVGDSAYLLMTLLRWHPGCVALLTENSARIGAWLTNADSVSAPGIAWLLNDISNDDRQLANEICDLADPTTVAATIVLSKRSEMGSWGYLIGRLAAAAKPAWCQRLVASLDKSTIFALPQSLTLNDLYGYTELWKGLQYLDTELGLEFVSASIPSIAAVINANPIEAISRLTLFFFDFPIWSEFVRRKRGAPAHLRNVYKRFARAIDPDAIVSALESDKPRHWYYVSDLLLAHKLADPYSAEQIALRLDFEQLDRVTNGHWQSMSSDLHQLVAALDISDSHEPARSWVLRHSAELERPTVDLARIVPEICAKLVRSGQALDLGTATGSSWERASEALARLWEVDPRSARDVLESNYTEIAKGLVNPHGHYDESLGHLLTLMRALAPSAVESVLVLLDPAEMEAQLRAMLRGTRYERHLAARLIQIALTLSTPHSDAAARLRQKFPVSSQAPLSTDA